MMQRVEGQCRKRERKIQWDNEREERQRKTTDLKKVTSKVIYNGVILKIMIAMEKQKSEREEKIN